MIEYNGMLYEVINRWYPNGRCSCGMYVPIMYRRIGMKLGTKEKPCKNAKDVKKVISDKDNAVIYVNGIFEIPKDILKELYDKNIKLWVVNRK